MDDIPTNLQKIANCMSDYTMLSELEFLVIHRLTQRLLSKEGIKSKIQYGSLFFQDRIKKRKINRNAELDHESGIFFHGHFWLVDGNNHIIDMTSKKWESEYLNIWYRFGDKHPEPCTPKFIWEPYTKFSTKYRFENFMSITPIPGLAQYIAKRTVTEIEFEEFLPCKIIDELKELIDLTEY